MDAGKVDPGSERPGRWSSARRLLRRRWLLVVTIMALTVSGATIGLLSGSGIASSCGGFSGSSGGGQCSADLSVKQFISVSPAHVGQRIFYLIVVTNKGPATASEVRLTDRLPLNVSGQWATTSEGYCEPIDKTKVADCSITYRLAAGQRAAVTLVVVPHSTVTLVNRAGVSSQTSDANPDNNVTTLRTRVQT
jgi:uncharacterized repeat protein (TIGR01451 family)